LIEMSQLPYKYSLCLDFEKLDFLMKATSLFDLKGNPRSIDHYFNQSLQECMKNVRSH